MLRRVFIAMAFLAISSTANAGEITDWFALDTYLRGRGMYGADGAADSLANTTMLGRLMNESSKIQIDAEARPTERIVGHIRLEGETLRGADTSGGSLGQMSLTQTYVQINNIFTEGLSFRVGSADYLMGVMQYYDLKPGRILLETYGLRADYVHGAWTFTGAVGDSGHMRRKGDYAPVVTGAIAVSWRGDSTTVYGAGEVYSEIEGPNGKSDAVGDPGYKLVAGVRHSSGDVLRRADAYVSLARDLPAADGTGKGVHGLTFGGELEIAAGDAFRLGVGTMATWHFVSKDVSARDTRNALEIAPLIRAEYAVLEDFHLLAESSYYARVGLNGGDTVHAWQGKGGVVVAPSGVGLLLRPHLRLLYGGMYVSDADVSLGQSEGKRWKHAFSAEFEIKF